MFLVVSEVLDGAELAAIHGEIPSLTFRDGAATAGRAARMVKANDQAVPSPELEAIQSKVIKALRANALFNSAARPRQISPLILSRYRPGQTYGAHVDDALMGGLRTDLSFTLFLSEPSQYDGGALVIEDTFEARDIRLEPGELLLYPSTTLHRVAPVTRGERLAVVGWVQSWLRSAEQREILFDLDRTLATILARDGKTEVHDTLAKTRSNLLRLWAEG